MSEKVSSFDYSANLGQFTLNNWTLRTKKKIIINNLIYLIFTVSLLTVD